MASPKPSRTQEWNESTRFSKLGTELAIDLLESFRRPNNWFRTLVVRDTESDREIQRLGIDLLWGVAAATCTVFIAVEVKADRNHATGNFFFETTSDIERQTPGTFLASSAELYFYTFPDTKEIYCLPLCDTREWFKENIESFHERIAHSSRDGRTWDTAGYLVPVRAVLSEVPGVRRYQLKDDKWTQTWNAVPA
ncbi:MAG: hypothetical protein U0136_22225 [Bdellovibrionota bacterium]